MSTQSKRKPAVIPIDPMLPLEFTVRGRAVPWSAPKVNRYGTSFPKRRFTNWRNDVQVAARVAWHCGHPPYTGPVNLIITIYFHKFGRIPDVTNCQKLIEDSLQGIVIANDRQVQGIIARRIYSTSERVVIAVLPASEMSEPFP
jgi:Holliday junction resolvase RusA-like endonuclease